MPIDINRLRVEKGIHRNFLLICAHVVGGDPEEVRESQRKRFADVEIVDKIIELDQDVRKGNIY